MIYILGATQLNLFSPKLEFDYPQKEVSEDEEYEYGEEDQLAEI